MVNASGRASVFPKGECLARSAKERGSSGGRGGDCLRFGRANRPSRVSVLCEDTMGARLTFAFAVFAVAPIVANACAGENNPYVLVVTAGQRVGSDGRVIDTVQPETVLKVEFAERDRYWVDDGKVGWLDRSRVIPADQKAIARLTQMIKADLQNGRLVRARSSVWIVLGEPDKALADCNRAIELNPKDARAYCSRGRVWRVKEQNDRALADFDQCIRLDPTRQRPIAPAPRIGSNVKTSSGRSPIPTKHFASTPDCSALMSFGELPE
jgi:hypothetical protein